MKNKWKKTSLQNFLPHNGFFGRKQFEMMSQYKRSSVDLSWVQVFQAKPLYGYTYLMIESECILFPVFNAQNKKTTHRPWGKKITCWGYMIAGGTR